MISFKAISRFFVIFLFTYSILLLPQPGIGSSYAEFFCSLGNKLFHHFGSDGYVFLQTQEGKHNIYLFLAKSSSTSGGKITGQVFNLESNLIGYYYTAFLIALIAATPLSWKRKFFALLLGFILITGFVMLLLRMVILYNYTLTPWIGLYQDTAAIKSINFWYTYIGAAVTMGYSIAIIVWLGVCIGKKEWRKLNGVFSQITANKKSGNKNHHRSKQGI